jgi:hypothetical protein
MKTKTLFLMMAIFFAGNAMSQNFHIEEQTVIQELPFGVAVKGNYLYVQGPSTSFNIYDISIPEEPEFIKTFEYTAADHGYEIEIHGDILHTAGGPGAIYKSFDISDPVNPIEKGTLTFDDFVGHFTATEFYCYVMNASYDSLYIINNTDIENPIIDTSLYVNGFHDLIAYGNILIAGESIFELTNPLNPIAYYNFNNYNSFFTMDTLSNMLFYKDHLGLYAMDISDVNNPTPLFSNDFSGGHIVYGNGFIVQEGNWIGDSESVFLYKVDENQFHYLEEFQGSADWMVTQMACKDSVFYVGKNGGVEVLKVVEGSPTNIDNINTEDVKVYPTVVHSGFNVSFDLFENSGKISVIDLSGKVLIETKLLEKDSFIDISELASGLYIVNISNGEEINYSSKIFKD